MILCQMKLIKVPEMIFTSALASIHFVKYSSATHSKWSELRRVLKKGKPLSADLEMNMFKAGSLPVSFCTCFLLMGGFMFTIAAIFWDFPRCLLLVLDNQAVCLS